MYKLIKGIFFTFVVMLMLTHPVYSEYFFYDWTHEFVENSIAVANHIKEFVIDTDAEMINADGKLDKPADNERKLRILNEKGYYYSTMSADEQNIYNLLLEKIVSFDASELTILLKDKEINHDWYELMNLCHNYIDLDHPEVMIGRVLEGYYSDPNFSNLEMINVEVSYNLYKDYRAIQNEQIVLIDSLNEIVRNTEGMTDFNKIRYFYEYLVGSVEYKIDGDEERIHKAIGAVIDNEAVCDGISEAMKLMCDLSDIPCIVITNESHAWNVIYHAGEVYHLDATWDLGKEQWCYFMLTYDELLMKDPENHLYDENRYTQLEEWFILKMQQYKVMIMTFLIANS